MLAGCLLWAGLMFAKVAPAEQPRSLVQAVAKRMTPTVVKLETPDGILSGTIITEDGLVLTCAHIPAEVGTKVTVGLSDGRRLTGLVKSKLPKPGESRRGKDVALVQIRGGGKFAFARLGQSRGLGVEDPLVAIGFPDTMLYGEDRWKDPAYVRLGHPVVHPYPTLPTELFTSIYATGGDSGGALFDARGDLVGVCVRGDLSGSNAQYIRMEAAVAGWRTLAGDRKLPAIGPRVRSALRYRQLALNVAPEIRSAVVEIRSREQWIGFGTVVGDGLILAKASELGPDLRVVLDGGAVALADVAATDPVRDLALVRLTYAPELTKPVKPVRWNPTAALAPGAMVAVATPGDFTPLFGVACFSARPVPPIHGIIPCGGKPVEGGVEVTEIWQSYFEYRLRRPTFPLRVGDVVTHIEGVAVRNREEWVKLVFEGKSIGAHPRVSGEPVRVTFVRDGKTINATTWLEFDRTPSSQLVRASSLRYSGFPSALAVDFRVRPEHSGAPVVDANGQVVGIILARAPFIGALVLPSSEVARSLSIMKSAMAKP